jgi:hypothetical protein
VVVISPVRLTVPICEEPLVPKSVSAAKDGNVNVPVIVPFPFKVKFPVLMNAPVFVIVPVLLIPAIVVKVPETVPPNDDRKFKMTFSPLDVKTTC